MMIQITVLQIEVWYGSSPAYPLVHIKLEPAALQRCLTSVHLLLKYTREVFKVQVDIRYKPHGAI